MKPEISRFIDRDRRVIDLSIGEVRLSYPLNPVPEILLEDLLSFTETDEEPEIAQKIMESNTLHKPVVCTVNSSHPFSINTAPKVVRMTLRDEVIRDKLEEIEGRFLSLQGRSYFKTRNERTELYQDLFLESRDMDPVRFGAVEMYGETTYTNILRDPRVTICFSWYRPKTRSFLAYHINCIAEIVPPDDPFYRFMRIMRSLFTESFLDLGQPEYPCAYKLWISETKEKTLTDKTGFSE